MCCWSSLANSSLGSLASLGLLCPANLMHAYCYGEQWVDVNDRLQEQTWQCNKLGWHFS